MATKSPAFSHFHDPEKTEKPETYKAQCKHCDMPPVKFIGKTTSNLLTHLMSGYIYIA